MVDCCDNGAFGFYGQFLWLGMYGEQLDYAATTM